jgi:hypothetical protein
MDLVWAESPLSVVWEYFTADSTKKEIEKNLRGACPACASAAGTGERSEGSTHARFLLPKIENFL